MDLEFLGMYLESLGMNLDYLGMDLEFLGMDLEFLGMDLQLWEEWKTTPQTWGSSCISQHVHMEIHREPRIRGASTGIGMGLFALHSLPEKNKSFHV